MFEQQKVSLKNHQQKKQLTRRKKSEIDHQKQNKMLVLSNKMKSTKTQAEITDLSTQLKRITTTGIILVNTSRCKD